MIETGAEILVFGHFHEEIRIDYRVADKSATAYVLPAWRTDHTYLRLSRGSGIRFSGPIALALLARCDRGNQRAELLREGEARIVEAQEQQLAEVAASAGRGA